ncbi:vinorine synthase [Ricinus communis]|uniref:3'-N-debenzoyl-2'-deoxytaxol N-benzoyltransferase, putative n=1 Tax=Ricinus communis TaxID=3988 RepID=B9SDG9_RICCO|nr:vinorine synthase [Ricinus communis]EEF38406.1 3'-N-debenzoyl-2'-deoxytaxol N-benzoyltransferase, putative [Ricinus communis]|eukprot:XP_025013990.1 vinorine synthase-like [Ricinus communis]
MEIEKISERFIKPSSPTPPHLKTYKISLIDQFLMYGIDIPMLFFYSNQPANPIAIDDFISKRSQLLKQSLSETLIHYYPLAGRIKDHLSVDCNDEGVCYVEAQANITLSGYFSQPDYLTLMDSLLPRQVSCSASSPGSYVVTIQVTTFVCGSITIGLFGAHMIMDAAGLISFVKAWAATLCNSRKETATPSFHGASIFPPYDAFPRDATMASFDEPFLKTGKLAARTFVFDASTISNLKAQATNSSVENPTRIEVVSSFLFECISAVLRAKSGTDKPFAFTFLVSWKRKAIPPLPENLFGNFIWMASGLSSPEQTKLSSLVCKVRETISKIGTDFVKDIRSESSDGAFSMLSETITGTRRKFTSSTLTNGVNFVMASSLCNLGLYDVDFGWGKPLWVTCVDVPVNSSSADHEFLNSVAFMDSRTGKGIEAWVFMDEEDLVLLEKYEKLLAYASATPNPLKPDLHVSHS